MTHLESRKIFAKRIRKAELFEYMDHWQLYMGQENLTCFLTIYEDFKKTQDVAGDIIELGPWQGTNLLRIAKEVRHFSPNFVKSIYSFDNFEGITNPAIEDNFDDDLRERISRRF